MDTVSGSRVIQLLGGGSYILGALGGDDAWIIQLKRQFLGK